LTCVCAVKGLSLGYPVGFVPGTDEAILSQVAGRDKGGRGAEQQGSKFWRAEE